MKCQDCEKKIDMENDVYFIMMNEDTVPLIICELCIKE